MFLLGAEEEQKQKTGIKENRGMCGRVNSTHQAYGCSPEALESGLVACCHVYSNVSHSGAKGRGCAAIFWDNKYNCFSVPWAQPPTQAYSSTWLDFSGRKYWPNSQKLHEGDSL